MATSGADRAFLHQPYYCEENVWQLCHHPALAGRRVDVVFVSNPLRSVAMWHQRAAKDPELPVVWDYHVFALALDPDEVWDLDCDLGIPVAAAEYFAASFGPIPPELQPWFRVVDRATFVAHFASDRAHMMNGGAFTEPPPPWPPIGPAGAPSNLMRFVDVTKDFVGEVKRLEAMGFGADL